MTTNIIVPAAGESVTEADIAVWYKSDGDYVEMDDALLELETDKASMDINAEVSGILRINVSDGTVQVGDVLGYIEPSEKQSVAATVSSADQSNSVSDPSPSIVDCVNGASSSSEPSYAVGHPSPAAAKKLAESGLSPADVPGTGKNGRILKSDVPSVVPPSDVSPIKEVIVNATSSDSRDINRERMSRLRRTIASRLVEAQQTSALLTTFNEVDMSAVMAVRSKYKEQFKDKHNVGLGFMSFFTRAVCDSLLSYPILNATVDGSDILYHNYCDIGIAVSTPKGLVVPIIRNAEHLSFHEIESTIVGYAKKGRDGKLTPDDMSGGTFTITNGGVFGSMMSTPIVNQPQSAILGMHNIVKRPVVVNDEIVIRPMMYLAVTYDHRIIDGADAVRFLVSIKELIEDPTRLLLGV